MGRETVSFRYRDMKGQFGHYGQAVVSISSNYTTPTDLNECPHAEIPVYSRYDMQFTKSRNYQNVKTKIRDKVRRSSYLFIGCTRQTYLNIYHFKKYHQ